MKVTAVSGSVLAASAGLAAAGTRTPLFHLVPTITSSSGSQDHSYGSWLTSFHVGAGQSTIVTTRDIQGAAAFYIEDGALIQNSSYPFVLSIVDQAPYRSDAPPGYNYVSLQIGSPDAGTRPFSYNKKTGEVKLQQKDFTFSVCHVNGTAPYFSVGPEDQLLWRRPATTKADPRKPSRCADVKLEAVELK